MSITGCFVGSYRALRLSEPMPQWGLIEFRFHGDSPFPEKAWLHVPDGRKFHRGELLLGGVQKCLLWRQDKPDVSVDYRVHAVGYEGSNGVVDMVVCP